MISWTLSFRVCEAIDHSKYRCAIKPKQNFAGLSKMDELIAKIGLLTRIFAGQPYIGRHPYNLVVVQKVIWISKTYRELLRFDSSQCPDKPKPIGIMSPVPIQKAENEPIYLKYRGHNVQ